MRQNRLFELIKNDETITSIEMFANQVKIKISDIYSYIEGEDIGKRALKKILKFFNCSEEYFYLETERRN